VAPARLCHEERERVNGRGARQVAGVKSYERLKVNYYAGNFSWFS
jgi:hypothetical protein